MDVLHYPGNCTDFDPEQVLGPDRFRGCWAIKSATYSSELDRTEVALRPIPPAELVERAQAAHEHLGKRIRVLELFGGVL